MTIIIVLVFFKSICLCLQNIVLNFYDRFMNPRRKYYTSSISNGNPVRGNRSILSAGALHGTTESEREYLIEQIRVRKRAARYSRTN